MTTEEKNSKLLVRYTIILVTICFLGSFVVSLNILDFIYLIFFYGFLFIYKVIK